ncbi:MAG: dUTP diphosphatase [Clostridium sp.]|nr:dUTP diphosphatase [Clostridium sp.]MCM1547991.1 dUTP diphosphatase [Ruminococcus sp.]
MTIKIKKLNENAVLPQRATEGSAGYDLSACTDSDIIIAPGEIKMIPTGIAAACFENAALMIYPRSGLASKHGIALANCVGVVDSDYRGEIKVPLINHGKESFTVTHAMRIAQMVVTPVLLPEIEETETLDETKRNTGGFGSTGK